MRKNLLNEIIIVCVSALCIFIMSSELKLNGKEEKKEFVNALMMKSDGVDIGLIESTDIGELAINIVKNAYITSANIENIKDIHINNNIEYENSLCNKESIMNEIEISNHIIDYNDKNNKSLFTFTVVKDNPIESTSKNNYEQVAFTAKPNGSQLYKEVFLDSSINTPIKGILTSTFGEQRGGYMHKGIDLAADIGTKIGVALDGVVTYSGVNGGYGKVIIVNHDNNMETVYAHCSKLNVNVGDKVWKGDVIGEVGNTGDSTGPHLHFEIRINGTAVDPLQYNKSKSY